MANKILIFVLLFVLALTGAWLYNKLEGGDNGIDSSNIQVTQTPNPNLNIIVSSPKSNDKVSNPIIVKGQARVFENTFSYILKDSSGNKLYEGNGMTDAKDAGILGNFEVMIPVPADAPKQLYVEVFEYSPKDGSVINLVSVPVEFK